MYYLYTTNSQNPHVYTEAELVSKVTSAVFDKCVKAKNTTKIDAGYAHATARNYVRKITEEEYFAFVGLLEKQSIIDKEIEILQKMRLENTRHISRLQCQGTIPPKEALARDS